MKKMAGLVYTALLLTTAHTQPVEQTKNIDKLGGCFDVVFKYAETFSPDPNYKYRERELMAAKELALPIEKEANKVVIQHLLVMDDTTVIKHWREDWTYE